MREVIVWILFCILLTVASFEAGYIYRSSERDDLYQQIQTLKNTVFNGGKKGP